MPQARPSRAAVPSAALRPAHRINDAILEIYRLGREAPQGRFQAAALEAVRECLRFDAAWWGNAAADTSEIHRLHLCDCDASIIEAYQPYMAQDFFRAALIAQPGHTVNLSDLASLETLQQTPLYADFGRRYGVAWSLGTLLVESVSSLYEFLTLWRHDVRKPFSEAERQTKELLMPHLAQAQRNHLLVHLLGGARTQGSRWAICDERGFLREASPGFIHAVRTHWPPWQGSRLPAELLDDVAKAAPASSAGGGRWTVLARGSYRYLEVPPADPLDALSAREKEVAQRYARGDTHAAIAAALGLAPATVRNHLASCYRKLAVNNKSELTLRVSGARATG